ncbi:hypothetical protein [Sphingomonas sp. Leaf21]|uniref:hypothetical protein n=1 Tax=Sphingomonas sp. Leaf21 TaxID=2876550 RepID=UPI001E656553|nr:hypothetical protein [Sphingomonas sp. Leaf21]
MSAPLTRCDRPGHVAPHFAPLRRPSDRGGRLARALTAHAARAGCTVLLTVENVEPWSSVTFTGSVVTLRLAAAPGNALSAWLKSLPEAEIPLGRDLIADIAAERIAGGRTLRVLLCLDAANG